VNIVDVVAVLLLVLAIAAGLRTGALPQVGGIAGAVGGFLVAVLLAPAVVGLVEQFDPLPRALIVLVGILAFVGIGEALGSAIGRRLSGSLGILSPVDRAGGGLVGGAQAALVIWLAGGLLAAGPIPGLASAANSSVAVRVVSGYLPPPTEIVGEVAGLLDASGLPEVFVGLEPIPLEPVDRPSDPLATRIAAIAEPSTGRVSALACGSSLSGTAFVVGPGYLATAAHVVAGSTVIRVAMPQGTVDAALVLFDPRLDLAVLHAPGLAAPALAFSGADPVRGHMGVALGFPGGGRLDVIPAAVAGAYPATGRDIYGNERVTRDILELRAAVDRGDSGGPFVLEDGTVGGVVFAESRTDPDVGYALTASEAAARIVPAIGRTASVDSGDCLR